MLIVLLLFVLLVGVGLYASSREDGIIVVPSSPTIITPSSPATPTPATPSSVTNTNSTTTIILNPESPQTRERAPYVEVNSATNISSSSARLVGRINPRGIDSTYWFEYSEDSLLGSLIGGGETAKSVTSAGGTTSVTSTITGLETNTKYYYRLVGRNAEDTLRSEIATFTTAR